MYTYKIDGKKASFSRLLLDYSLVFPSFHVGWLIKFFPFRSFCLCVCLLQGKIGYDSAYTRESATEVAKKGISKSIICELYVCVCGGCKCLQFNNTTTHESASNTHVIFPNAWHYNISPTPSVLLTLYPNPWLISTWISTYYVCTPFGLDVRVRQWCNTNNVNLSHINCTLSF